MKNIKKLVLLICCFCLLTGFTPNPHRGKDNLISPTAWPDRPGGNGDGSEEWLQGSYGQTNGPFVKISSSQGTVADLENMESVVSGIGSLTLTALSAYIGVSVSEIVGVGLTLIDIGKSIFDKGYQGAYYKSTTYVSGRCMKIIIKTYKNSDYSGYVATYTRYKKW